jgi:hypothetical protein
LLDDFFARCESLKGPPYNIGGGRNGESLALAQQRGVDCSGMIDVSLRDMGLPYSGNTLTISNRLLGRQPYRSDGWYPRGTVLVNDDFHPGRDRSHVAVVHDAEKQLIINSRRPDGVVDHEHHAESDEHANYIWVGYLPQLGVDLDPRYFPGWFAHPALVAVYMASVARNEFSLPEVLPVMCSIAELADAWVPSPVAINEVPGYSYAVDHDSLGFFQQRPAAGWGQPEQVMDPEYALRAFCRAAANLRPDPEPRDATGLGEWCANVQRPSREYRHRYAAQHGRALQLIEQGRRLLTPPRPNKGIRFAEVNFAAAGYADQIAAYVAAAALANIWVKSFVATEDNIKMMDAALWPEPIGHHHIVVVGRQALDLLPKDRARHVYYPPRPDESSYYGAVGLDYGDTIKRLALVLDRLFYLDVGHDFIERMEFRV